MWRPTVATATQVSRWFQRWLLRTEFTDSFMFDFDWLGHNGIHSTARNLHTSTRTHVRKWTWMYNPTGPLVGLYNVFSRSKHCTVDVLGGVGEGGGVFCNSSRFDHPLETWRSFTECDKPTRPQSQTADARLLRRDPAAGKHGYFLEKKVVLSCCLKQWGVAQLAHWNIKTAAATTATRNNVKMHGLINKAS